MDVMKMHLKRMAWVGSWATLFFFLPSLAGKLWEAFAALSWRYQRWFVYPALAGLIIVLVRRRIAERKMKTATLTNQSLADILKQRLVKGEISLEEFRRIRLEIQNNDEY
jgi:uncharacterized membrane protein